MINDVILLRLPLKPEYLPVLRATVGVIAGAISFDYNEIIQLRVAISEVFDLALKQAARQELAAEGNELAVRFTIGPGKVEILTTSPADYTSQYDSEEEKESRALLESLMDEVEISAGPGGKTLVRMGKYKPTEGASEQHNQV